MDASGCRRIGGLHHSKNWIRLEKVKTKWITGSIKNRMNPFTDRVSKQNLYYSCTGEAVTSELEKISYVFLICVNKKRKTSIKKCNSKKAKRYFWQIISHIIGRKCRQ